MNRIKELRKQHKLSQRDLSEQIGVNIRSVQRWERGEGAMKPQRQRAWLIFLELVWAIFWGIRKPQTFQMKNGYSFQSANSTYRN